MNHSDSSPIITGQMLTLMILSGVLAFACSLWLLKRYRKAVVASMHKRITQVNVADFVPSNSITQNNAPVISEGIGKTNTNTPAAQRAKRAQRIYLISIAAFALYTSIISLVSGGIEVLPLRTTMYTLTYVWPFVMLQLLLFKIDSRTRIDSVLIYFALFFGVGTVAQLYSGFFNPWQLIILFSMTNLLPSALLLLFYVRKIRSVGSLAVVFFFLALCGSLIVLSFFGSSDARLYSVVDVGMKLGMNGTEMFISLIALGLLLFSVPGWLMLKKLAKWYTTKVISDQSINIDSLVLFFSVSYSVGNGTNGIFWLFLTLAGYVIYKLLSIYLFKRWKNEEPEASSPSRLLLLRVFSLGKRSEQLFDSFGQLWRYTGSIHMIAGPDLATSAVQPHEFLDYISGKLSRRFIDSRDAFETRLKESDYASDADKRYRVNEFFCQDDTWTMVLKELLSRSECILMDLRGFDATRQGCKYEIEALLNFAPLEKVVYVVDQTTNQKLLRELISQFWQHMNTASPNFGTSDAVRLFDLKELSVKNVHELVATVTSIAAKFEEFKKIINEQSV